MNHYQSMCESQFKELEEAKKELALAHQVILEMEETIKAFSKNALASNPQGYELGEEFYIIEIGNKFIGMREFSRDVLTKHADYLARIKK